ncbi:cyclic nucleotide-gated channel rod photoreceptor subunit alpha-like isoform X2 [Dreissena polymorpha]|nr:cyclic nucleotide-gated channel rod photoreceptor subunit alpha-like isoform X2 [Dreissena polymorpha]
MAHDAIQMKGIFTDKSVNMADTMVNEDNGHVKDGNHNAKDRWGKLKSAMSNANTLQIKKTRRVRRDDSFLRKFSTRPQFENSISESEQLSGSIHSDNKKHIAVKPFVVHPSGDVMFYWLGAVTLAVLYNLWTCIARQAFHEIQKRHVLIWLCLDGVADFVYLLDIGVQFRTGFLHQGLIVYDYKKLCKNYINNKCFIIDIVSLVPLDLLQFYIGIQPMLRFPRFLKVYRSIRFMHMYESRTGYPNLLRVANLSHILFLGSHWFAAFYYLISEAEDFQEGWAYPKPEGVYAHVTRKYLASLYWSTLTLTTIGDLPPPDTNWQYTFVIVSYLIGVFIFATIVGQVGSVITNRNASRQEFERLLDGAKFYMQMHNVPSDLQKRVQRWYDYVWTRGRLNCHDINSLGLLPDKLKTELALHVNLGTLRKVTIFQKCKPEFLHDLMLKMKAYIFTPEDLICRRGEVAREMFIIVDGVVEIMGDKGTVLTQMSSGDFFGEIGILNLNDGVNRRTADVRSVGYSELFVLSREDVLGALKEHPDAEVIIREYGHRRLKETEKHRQQARSAPGSPDLVQVNGTTNKIHSKTDMSSRKYLNKLKKMPPGVRKFFSLKSRCFSKASHYTQNGKWAYHSSIKNAFYGETSNRGVDNLNRGQKPAGPLDIEQDREQNDVTKSKPPCSPKIADLVLSIFNKTRRRSGYSSVETDDNDNEAIEKERHSNPMTNSAEDYTGPLANSFSQEKRSLSNITNSRNLSFNSKTNRDFSKKSSPVSSAPSIILTQDTDDTSSSESDEEIPRAPSTQFNHPKRSYARNSIPCAMPVDSCDRNTPTMSPRKYSIPPRLDLPIDVHPFRRGSVHNTSDIQLCLEGLKFHIENRLDLLEASCKDTKLLLKKSMAAQEQFMTLIMNSIKTEKNTVSGSPSYKVLPDHNEMRRSQDLAEHVEKQSIKTNEEDASCNRPTADKYAITYNESGDGFSTVHNIQCRIKKIDSSNNDDPYKSGNSASELYITHL